MLALLLVTAKIVVSDPSGRVAAAQFFEIWGVLPKNDIENFFGASRVSRFSQKAVTACISRNSSKLGHGDSGAGHWSPGASRSPTPELHSGGSVPEIKAMV